MNLFPNQCDYRHQMRLMPLKFDWVLISIRITESICLKRAMSFMGQLNPVL